MEIYKGAYLLYGQGNFLFYKNRPVIGTTSLLLEIIIGEDGKPHVRHHLTCHDGYKVWLDPEQDLSDFEERNRRMAAGDTFEKEFSEACASKKTMFLRNMRGNNLIDRILFKLLPQEKFLRYLRKRYRPVDILRIVEVLRCEEINEVMERGMLEYLNDEM